MLARVIECRIQLGGRLITHTTIEMEGVAGPGIEWRITNRGRSCATAQPIFRRFPGRNRTRTHAREFVAAAKIEIKVTPTATGKKVEVNLLVDGRSDKGVNTFVVSRALVVIPGESTVVKRHAVRTGWAFLSKLTFKHALVSPVKSDTHGCLSRKIHLELR